MSDEELEQPWAVFVNMLTNEHETIRLEAKDGKHFVFLHLSTANRGSLDIGLDPKEFDSFAFGVQEAQFALHGEQLVLLRGNLSTGFVAYGPFKNEDAVRSWQVQNQHGTLEFDWLMYLTGPYAEGVK